MNIKALNQALSNFSLWNRLATKNIRSNLNSNTLCWGGLQKSDFFSEVCFCNAHFLESDQLKMGFPVWMKPWQTHWLSTRHSKACISSPSSCARLWHHVYWRTPSYACAHTLPTQSSAFQKHFEKPRHPSKGKRFASGVTWVTEQKPSGGMRRSPAVFAHQGPHVNPIKAQLHWWCNEGQHLLFTAEHQNPVICLNCSASWVMLTLMSKNPTSASFVKRKKHESLDLLLSFRSTRENIISFHWRMKPQGQVMLRGRTLQTQFTLWGQKIEQPATPAVSISTAGTHCHRSVWRPPSSCRLDTSAKWK